MKLRRLGAGLYETLDGRYRVERQDGTTECDHPLCDPLHQKFWTRTGDGRGAVHWIDYPAWHVWDNEKDDYISDDFREFETKGAAVAALGRHLEPR